MKVVRWVGILIGVVAILAIVLGGVMMLMSESGEVVVLRTLDAQGEPRETRLWIVEHDGAEWLRAGQAESGWFRRLSANPDVVLERDGREWSFEAVPVREPATRDRINALMNEKYGFPDTVIGATLRDNAASVPVRLDHR
jgi:hypothetical protein